MRFNMSLISFWLRQEPKAKKISKRSRQDSRLNIRLKEAEKLMNADFLK